MKDNELDRRRFVTIAGAASVLGIAGCTDMGDEGEPDDPGDGPGDEPDDDPGDEPGDDEAADDTEAWEDVDEIVLDGDAQGWVGAEPESIADEDNPTLVLFEGEEYEITWENVDGQPHNVALLDDGEEVIEATEEMDEEGETQTLEFEATAEMAEYVCEPHEQAMRGEIEVEDGDEAPEDDEEDAPDEGEEPDDTPDEDEEPEDDEGANGDEGE